MRNNLTKIFAVMAMSVMTVAAWASPIAIPTTLGNTVDFNDAVCENCKVESEGLNVGSTYSNTVITFSLTNATEQEYYVKMRTAAKDLTAVLTITVKNGDTELFSTDRNVENTGQWYLADDKNPTYHNFSIGSLPVGTLTLEIRVKSTTGSYAGNYGYLAIHGANQYDNIPSETAIDIEHADHHGCSYESAADKLNVGNIKNGCYSIYNVYLDESAYSNPNKVYLDMHMNINWFKEAGQVQVSIYDIDDLSTPERQQTFDITAKTDDKVFKITDFITPGFKQIRLDYIAGHSNYIFNYKNLRFVERDDEAGDDPSAVTFGLTRSIDAETSTSSDSQVSDKYHVHPDALVDPSVAGISMTMNYGNQDGLTDKARTMIWYNGSSAQECYVDKDEKNYRNRVSGEEKLSLDDNCYFGFDIDVQIGYTISIVRLHSDVLKNTNNSHYLVKIFNNGTVIKTFDDVEATNVNTDMKRSISLSQDADLQNLTGTITVKMYFWNTGSPQYVAIKDLNVKAIVTALPNYTREHPHMNLNTLCYPYQIDYYTGATFYTILETEVEAGELTKLVLEEHEGALEAGVPYFYDPTEGETELVCYYSGDRQETPQTAANGAFIGAYADNTAVPEGSYVTVNNQLYKCGANVTLAEYRAYVTPETFSRAAIPGRRQLRIGGANMPTDIDQIVNGKCPNGKFIKDGQLFILRDGKTYNAQGQLIEK